MYVEYLCALYCSIFGSLPDRSHSFWTENPLPERKQTLLGNFLNKFFYAHMVCFLCRVGSVKITIERKYDTV